MGSFVRMRNPCLDHASWRSGGPYRSTTVNATIVPSGDRSGVAAPAYPGIVERTEPSDPTMVKVGTDAPGVPLVPIHPCRGSARPRRTMRWRSDHGHQRGARTFRLRAAAVGVAPAAPGVRVWLDLVVTTSKSCLSSAIWTSGGSEHGSALGGERSYVDGRMLMFLAASSEP